MSVGAKSAGHLTDLPNVKSLSTTASLMSLSYSSQAPAATGAALGWYSPTQCAASRYRSLLLPTPEYHLPVPANCHMSGTQVSAFAIRPPLRISTVVAPRPTQPLIPPGSVNEDQLRLERQGQVFRYSSRK